MKLKRIAKYFLLSLFLIIVIAAIWAQYGLVQLYGGHTQVVDYKQFDIPNKAVCIKNINVLSADGTRFLPRQTVCIDKGVIVSIDSISTQPVGFEIINGEGKYLIPGLIDSHVHLFKSPNDLLLYVANGVTHIREMIGEPDHLTWREEIKNGRLGPEMYVASPRFASFGFWQGLFMVWSQGYTNVTNAQEATEKVLKYHKEGYDGIKIYSQLNKESYIAISKVADSLGMDIIGHIPSKIRFSDVWNNKQKEIAHFEEIMNGLNREFDYFGNDDQEAFFKFIDEKSDSIAQHLIKNNIAVTSVLWGWDVLYEQHNELESILKKVKLEYENPGIIEGHALTPEGGLGWLPGVNANRHPANMTEEQTRGRNKWWSVYAAANKHVGQNLAKRGVKILAGTDCNLSLKVPGFAFHDELKSLNAMGMTPAQVLQSATTIPAEWLRSKAGKIEKGYKANLVILDKNPLEDISNTKAINTVILNGKILNRNTLDKILESVKNANNASRKKDISQFLQK
jgi:hypothetical protein